MKSITTPDPTSAPPITSAPTSTPIISDCKVGGQDGACVESRAYCRTPYNDVEESNWRAADPCEPRVCCLLQDVIPVTNLVSGAGVPSSSGAGVPSSSGAGVPSSSGAGVPSSSGTGVPSSSGAGVPSSSGGGVPSSSGAGVPSSSGAGVPSLPGGGVPNSSGAGAPSATPLPSTTTTSTTTLSPISSVTCGIQKWQTVAGYFPTKNNEAGLGEFPWTINLGVMIGLQNGQGQFQYAGTGSLIHDRVVLTAAHVLRKKDLNNLRAIVGDHDQMSMVLPKKLVEVSDVVIHSNFHSGNGDNNFALVFLATSALENQPNVGTVCLPPANYVATAGASCAFSGWGTDANRKPQKQLVKTEVPMMTHTACEQRLRQNPKLGPGFQLLPSFTCAGGEIGKDLCGGAGGSPLVCPIESDPSRYVQTGIVSWVTSCGVDGSPAVFADVSTARSWIDQELAKRQYSTESYTY